MCCDLPTVTTDVGCANELLIDGVHGLVVPADNQLALELAIREISTNKNLYSQIKNNLKHLDKNTLAGVDINSYGEAWAQSLS
jgi:glycosyltransferase involved in cell wall biosynthesis